MELKESDKSIQAEWDEDADGNHYVLTGNLGEMVKKKSHQDVSFTLLVDQKKYFFKGKIDRLRIELSGFCSDKDQNLLDSSQSINRFHFRKADDVPGKLNLKIGGIRMLEEKEIVLDYQSKTIRSAPGSESEIEIRAIEAVD